MGQGTYSTPMTSLTMDWNSSSVYSRVGNGASLIVEGLNCLHDILGGEGASIECKGDSIASVSNLDAVCWEAYIMKESITC